MVNYQINMPINIKQGCNLCRKESAMGVGRINIHSFYDNYTIGSKHNNNLQNTEDVQIEQTGAGSQDAGSVRIRLTRKLTKHLYILILKNLHLILRTETDSILLLQQAVWKMLTLRKLYLIWRRIRYLTNTSSYRNCTKDAEDA